jgi:hypothetical protein
MNKLSKNNLINLSQFSQQRIQNFMSFKFSNKDLYYHTSLRFFLLSTLFIIYYYLKIYVIKNKIIK